MDAGTLRAIYVYPVKSLAGISLNETRIEPNGLPGDRERALVVQAGHARIGKTYRGKEHNLLHLQRRAEDAAALAAHAGVTVSIERDEAARFFDERPVSLLFDRWVDDVSRALGIPLDPLRWRPNLFAAAGAFQGDEAALLGAVLELGRVLLRVIEPIHRCVTTTYDVRTGEPNPDVLRHVAQERANTMGVYCVVERAGTVRVGDALRLRAR